MSDVATARTRRKVIAAGVSGNVLEWYDFGGLRVLRADHRPTLFSIK